MADQIELLKQLQAVDGELYRLRQQLERQPRELDALSARLAVQDARLKEAESRLKALQTAQKEKELELQTREANVKKLQGQLFQLKTNKEYSAMQREIETLRADNSVLEEAILKSFDELEQAAARRRTEQERLASEQQAVAGERQRLEQTAAAVREQIAQLERSRRQLAPDVPPQTLTMYERVLALREGLALVPLISDACGGCHRRLPPQVINQVLLKATVTTCESCNRILYFDEAHSKL